MTTHQIVINRTPSTGGGRELVGRCGATQRYRPSDPHPQAFTIWHSRVTCEECLYR